VLQGNENCHQISHATGEESAIVMNAGGRTFGEESKGEDQPEGSDGEFVEENLFGGFFHPEQTGINPLGVCQNHSRKDEEQQEIHRKVEKSRMELVGIVLEILEKDRVPGSVQKVAAIDF